MDRLFLDANVLFSAAYSEASSLRRLWRLARAEVITSRYALEEARRNLDSPERLSRLEQLVAETRVRSIDDTAIELPPKLVLRDKDRPILRAAIAVEATHLLTGDLRDFGSLFGKTVAGVLIVRPADYLRPLNRADSGR